MKTGPGRSGPRGGLAPPELSAGGRIAGSRGCSSQSHAIEASLRLTAALPPPKPSMLHPRRTQLHADSSEPTGSLETKPLWVRQSVNQAAGDQRRFWNPVGRNGLSALLPGGPSRRAICTGMLPAVLPTPPKLGSSAVCSLVFRTIFEGFILTHITVSPARLTRLCGRLLLCLPADPPTPLLRWLVFLFLETLPSAILSLSFAYSQRPLLSFFSCKGDGQCLRHTGSPWPRGH